ncbi:methylosome protein 50-like isoform X2 [Gigantopelta aegis]|uniref:methylosome protein 50-like isoform X2 n=1 Tax=Gigantopelta aegis TaxID=1735272 RepID=UPI001B88D9A0|nr:methylosome protein 50-like isoform X2 [Gigantopelta aegis]
MKLTLGWYVLGCEPGRRPGVQLMASPLCHQSQVSSSVGGVAIWQLTDDFRTFVLSCSAIEHDDIVSCVTVTADGTKAISSGYDGMIKLWDLSKLSSLNSCRVHYDIIWSVECHPTETDLFLSCSQDGQVLLWDCRNPRPASIVEIPQLEGSPTCVSWQPGTQHVAAVSSDLGQVIVNDIRMNKETATVFSPHSRFVYKTEFCPGKPNLLASVGEDCRTVVTDLQNDSVCQVYSEVCHSDFVHGLTWFGSDSLYTCGWDSQIKLHSLNGVPASDRVKQEPVVMAVNGDLTKEQCDMVTDSKPNYSQVVQGCQEVTSQR